MPKSLFGIEVRNGINETAFVPIRMELKRKFLVVAPCLLYELCAMVQFKSHARGY